MIPKLRPFQIIKKCPPSPHQEKISWSCGNTSRKDKINLGYVKNKHTNKITGAHFNLTGHRQSDMEISIIEKIHSTSEQYRKQREKMFISRFNTKYKGMNKIS